ncbi:hypothetical protein K469DRAFT_787623 [Zopfia rhizophila CBS 207.26]|uniref:Uncharacterized protein n=1 Tax=Zopfia rhizophila CBS 207.26 TaxID=1314779 RepID=A0A6A6DTA7_9PEZI|nr:hypothetical protein K469DRAFT_787623 [Zopfia rhizophila CBS 207.26]
MLATISLSLSSWIDLLSTAWVNLPPQKHLPSCRLTRLLVWSCLNQRERWLLRYVGPASRIGQYPEIQFRPSESCSEACFSGKYKC